LLLVRESGTLSAKAIGVSIINTCGLADNFLGQSIGEVLASPGDAIGGAVMEGKAAIPERVRKSLRRKSAFVIPFLRVIEVAYTVGLMAQPTLHVCEEDDSGKRIEHDVQMESDKPPVRDMATEVAVGRARAEGIAAVKMAATELLRQRGTPADQIRLDPIRPFSAAEIQYLKESGLTSMEVAKLAETRYGAIGHEFKMCPDAELAFFAFFDPF